MVELLGVSRWVPGEEERSLESTQFYWLPGISLESEESWALKSFYLDKFIIKTKISPPFTFRFTGK